LRKRAWIREKKEDVDTGRRIIFMLWVRRDTSFLTDMEILKSNNEVPRGFSEVPKNKEGSTQENTRGFAGENTALIVED